jgi:hypothetical protein
MLDEEPLSWVEVEAGLEEIHHCMRMLGRGMSGVEGQAELYEVGGEAACAQVRDSIWLRL